MRKYLTQSDIEGMQKALAIVQRQLASCTEIERTGLQMQEASLKAKLKVASKRFKMNL